METVEAIRHLWINRPQHEMYMGLAEWSAACQGIREGAKGATKIQDVCLHLAEKASGRPQHVSGRMNKLEAKYAAHLTLRIRTGEIRDWKFEPLKLKLAPATFYNPDFGVRFEDGRIELHETKGHWEDDARVKVKVAAAMFPWFTFVGARWDKAVKDWKFEEFKA